jgi:putative SOS response-associated peptidase YedK
MSGGTIPSGKTPFAIARHDGEPVALGGMWEAWRSDGETLRTFATLTTEANPTLALIQGRMPAIIERADWPLWLGEADGDAAALLRPLPASRLRIWPVGRTVNNVRNDGPDLLAPCSLPVDADEHRHLGRGQRQELRAIDPSLGGVDRPLAPPTDIPRP